MQKNARPPAAVGYIYGLLPPIPALRSFPGVEPVKPHITLVRLRRPVMASVRYRRFVVVLGPAVLLPSESRPRYIALRAEPHGELAALRALLVAALGNAVEERHASFKPHMSLYAVRIKRPSREDLGPALDEASKYVGASFEVREVHLIDAAGGLYTPVYTIQLAD
jgi:2'-5' RNA ligase